MTIPSEIFELAERLIRELDGIEEQTNEGLTIANRLLARFPNNVRIVELFASLGNVLFFVNSFRMRIGSAVQEMSGNSISVETIQEVGEELSADWGKILECKMTVQRSVDILRALQ